jgi:hypothetical protein
VGVSTVTFGSKNEATPSLLAKGSKLMTPQEALDFSKFTGLHAAKLGAFNGTQVKAAPRWSLPTN